MDVTVSREGRTSPPATAVCTDPDGSPVRTRSSLGVDGSTCEGRVLASLATSRAETRRRAVVTPDAMAAAAALGSSALRAVLAHPFRTRRDGSRSDEVVGLLARACARAVATRTAELGGARPVVHFLIVDDPARARRWGLPHTVCSTVVWPSHMPANAGVAAHEIVHVLQRWDPAAFEEAYAAEGRWRAVAAPVAAARRAADAHRCPAVNPDAPSGAFAGHGYGRPWRRRADGARCSASLVVAQDTDRPRLAVSWRCDGGRAWTSARVADYDPNEDAAEVLAAEAAARIEAASV